MRAIQIVGRGSEAVLELGEAPEPVPQTGEILIDIAATALNRADLLQRRGLYPPPPGATEILGLECSGTVAGLGEGVSSFSRGERVMALLPGGGYAERVTVDAGSAMRIPDVLSFEVAAGIPETFLTCYLNLLGLAGLREGQAALVHGGGSGIGTSAIQLLGLSGIRTIVTCGSAEKCERARALGADVALDYSVGPFAASVLEATKGRGVDAILDSIGAPYLAQHLECLASGGTLVFIGLMGGAQAEIQLAQLLLKRLHLIGSTLRGRPTGEKARIVSDFLERFGEALEQGELRAVVDRVLPLESAAEAHAYLEASAHFGKVVLRVR